MHRCCSAQARASARPRSRGGSIRNAMTRNCCMSMRSPAGRHTGGGSLRLFSNIAPDGAAREWRVGEPFAHFARKFLPRARGALPGSAWLLGRFGVTKGRRSAYDQVMLRLHDEGKQDAVYQADGPLPNFLSLPENNVAYQYVGFLGTTRFRQSRRASRLAASPATRAARQVRGLGRLGRCCRVGQCAATPCDRPVRPRRC